MTCLPEKSHHIFNATSPPPSPPSFKIYKHFVFITKPFFARKILFTYINFYVVHNFLYYIIFFLPTHVFLQDFFFTHLWIFIWYINVYIMSYFFLPHMHFYKNFFTHVWIFMSYINVYIMSSFFCMHHMCFLCEAIYITKKAFFIKKFYTSMNFYVIHKCLHYIIFFLYAPCVFSLCSHIY